MFGFALGVGGGRAEGATTTLSPEQESAIPTADPAHMVPDEILVQFAEKRTAADLAAFEARFHLDLMNTLDIPPDQPYYQFHIDDGSTPPDKRLEILAGDPLVAWCQPNITGELAVVGSSTPTPTAAPTPTAMPTATPGPTGVPSGSANAAPAPAKGNSPDQTPWVVIAAGLLAALALALAGGFFAVLRSRRAR